MRLPVLFYWKLVCDSNSDLFTYLTGIQLGVKDVLIFCQNFLYHTFPSLFFSKLCSSSGRKQADLTEQKLDL